MRVPTARRSIRLSSIQTRTSSQLSQRFGMAGIDRRSARVSDVASTSRFLQRTSSTGTWLVGAHLFSSPSSEFPGGDVYRLPRLESGSNAVALLYILLRLCSTSHSLNLRACRSLSNRSSSMHRVVQQRAKSSKWRPNATVQLLPLHPPTSRCCSHTEPDSVRTALHILHFTPLSRNDPDKEHFEPLLHDLLAAQNTSGRHPVCEAWAFDWQTHGDSAILNKALISPGSTELPGESQVVVFILSAGSAVRC